MSENLDRVCEDFKVSENLDAVCVWAMEWGKLRNEDYIRTIHALRAEFAALERKAASAIIPTPELREAVEAVCKIGDDVIEDCERLNPHASFPFLTAIVDTVRAAFKEPNND